MSILAKNLVKSVGNPEVTILHDVSLQIQSEEFVALTGRSGSGKSTLLYLLGSLDEPTKGEIEIDGAVLSKMSAHELSHFRNTKLGFVFQFHYLISELSAIENVLLPARKAGQHKQRREFAAELLSQVGLGAKLDRYPRQMSGGEQQRVAIARALVMEPSYLFADEPTGALDSVNGTEVMKLFSEINVKNKTTIVMVTHDPGFAARASRVIQLADGKVLSKET